MLGDPVGVRRRPLGDRTRPRAGLLAAVLVLALAPTPTRAATVGGPTGAPYPDEEACAIPWLEPGASAVIEGITVTALVNESLDLGSDPAEGLHYHSAPFPDFGIPVGIGTTELTFDPAITDLEVTVTLLGDATDPAALAEEYVIVGTPTSGPAVLDWTLTDEDAAVSGTFDPPISTLRIDYEPTAPTDGLIYAATIRLRVPRVGETCDTTETPIRDPDDRDDDAELEPVPTAVPSGTSSSGSRPVDGALLGAAALLSASFAASRRALDPRPRCIGVDGRA